MSLVKQPFAAGSFFAIPYSPLRHSYVQRLVVVCQVCVDFAQKFRYKLA